jgi:hypothetical protein
MMTALVDGLALLPAPALQTLELIDGPVHVALDAGLVALKALESRATGDC